MEDYVKKAFLLQAMMVWVLLGAGCAGGDESDKAAAAGQAQRGLPEIVLRSGQAEVRVELAVTDEQKNIGLMFRRELADGRGMLFVYDADQRMSYWMKNTFVPLSIAFLSADGVIREIYDMQPESLASVSSSRSVRYALEVPQGWFGRAGLRPGDQFNFPEGFPD